MDLAEALDGRHSVRAYLDRAVTRAEVAAILRAARRAPSGANLQPGGFHALTGGPLADLTAALARAEAEDGPETPEFRWFPDPMPPELKDRQRRAGAALYAALGIARRDVAGRRAQWARNYAFFGAPVGLVVTIDRRMGEGAWLDLGMAVMAAMLAARGLGLGTTAIGALANHGRLVRDFLGLPGTETVVCGLALGHPDPDAPVNATRTERLDLPGFATFHGFEDDA